MHEKISPQSWDDEDDKLLIKLKEVDNLGWKQIAGHFRNRTSNACQFRWRRLKSGQLKKPTKLSKVMSGNSNHTNTSQSYKVGKPLNSAYTCTSAYSVPTFFTRPYHPPQLEQLPPPTNNSWGVEEDILLRSRGTKGLSVAELSILLRNRSIRDIEDRIHYLENSNRRDTGIWSSPMEPEFAISPTSSVSSITSATITPNNPHLEKIKLPRLQLNNDKQSQQGIVLPPLHSLFQFEVDELDSQRKLPLLSHILP